MRTRLTLQVSGGLGNQLFMLTASASVLNIDGVDSCDIDLTTVGTKHSPHASGIHNLSLDAFVGGDLDKLRFFRSSRVRRFVERKIGIGDLFEAADLGFNELIIPPDSDGVRFIGYFQSERYLHEARLRSWPLRIEPAKFRESFLQAKEFFTNVPAAFIHIRRGDYLFHKDSLGVLEAGYFKRGVEALMREGFSNFCVISDDQDWAERIISFLPAANYFSLSSKFDLSDEETISIASEAPAIVISNSTYGYWAAMAGVKKAVIAPKDWFKSLPAPKDLFASSDVVFCDSVWLE